MWNRGIWQYANFKKLDDTFRHLRIYVFLNICFQKSPHGGHVHFLHKSQVPDFLYCDYFEQYGMLHNLALHTYNSPRVITDSRNDRMFSEYWIGEDFETRRFGLI
jgi:hypothetical protein